MFENLQGKINLWEFFRFFYAVDEDAHKLIVAIFDEKAPFDEIEKVFRDKDVGEYFAAASFAKSPLRAMINAAIENASGADTHSFVIPEDIGFVSFYQDAFGKIGLGLDVDYHNEDTDEDESGEIWFYSNKKTPGWLVDHLEFYAHGE